MKAKTINRIIPITRGIIILILIGSVGYLMIEWNKIILNISFILLIILAFLIENKNGQKKEAY